MLLILFWFIYMLNRQNIVLEGSFDIQEDFASIL